MGTAKQKFALEEARRVAAEISVWLGGTCERLQVAGSVRRNKPLVGDVELLVIPRNDISPTEGEFFATEQNQVNLRVLELLRDGQLALRVKKDGTVANGEQVKLLRHVPSGMPVDLFIATEDSWFSSLVCRTGGKDSNARIATLAKRMGWRWQMNGPGFRRLADNHIQPVSCERDVFEFVGLPYREPQERD